MKNLSFPRSTLIIVSAVSLLLSGRAANATVMASSLEMTIVADLKASGGVTFTTDSQAYVLNSVQIAVDAFGGDPDEVVWRPGLYALGDDPFPSGSAISTSFSLPSLGSRRSKITFTATEEIILAANTTYMFTLILDAGYADWSVGHSSSSYDGPWTIKPVYAYKSDLGWEEVDFFPLVSIDATAVVPEPSTGILMGGSALLFAACLRRRK